MISFFRRAMSSWIVLGLLGLVLIAFIVTGVGDPFGGMGGGAGGKLATVGKTAIGQDQIRQQLDRAVRNARQQDPGLDTASYVKAGGFDQILSQSIIAEAIKQWADKHGFDASRRQVDGEIASIPAFQIGGRFDQKSYESALAQQKLSDRELREGLKGDIIRKQVLLPVAAGAAVSEGIVKPYAELLLEERTGSVGIVPSRLLADTAPPSAADVRAFYAKNANRYLVPERRVMRYALIGPEQVAAAATPTEAEIKKFFDSNQATYGPSEKRTLSQVVLPDEAAAKALAARAKKGEAFAALAAQAGYAAADIALGEQGQAQFASSTSPRVAAAAFAAPAGGTTDAIQSDYGWHVVHVDKVANTPGRPLQAVQAEITEKLTAQKREEAMADLVGKIEDGLGNGQSLSDVVKAHGLTEATTPALTAGGLDPDNAAYKAPPELAAVLKAGYTLSPDDDPVVEEAGKDRYAIVAVSNLVQAAPRPLAQIGEQVTADLVRARASEKAKALANQILAKVKAGTPLAKALADAKMPPPQTATNRRIDLASRGDQVPPPLALMFTMQPGGARILTAPNDQGWFIVKVDEVRKGDVATAPAIMESTRAQFNQFAGDEYVAQFARAVAAEIGMKRNEKAITRLKRELAGDSTGEQ